MRGILEAESEVIVVGGALLADKLRDSAGSTICDMTWCHDSNGSAPVATSA